MLLLFSNLFVAPEWNQRRPEWWHRVTPNWEPSWACVLLSFAQNCHFNYIKINSQVPKKANLKLFAITCLCSQFALTRSLIEIQKKEASTRNWKILQNQFKLLERKNCTPMMLNIENKVVLKLKSVFLELRSQEIQHIQC